MSNAEHERTTRIVAGALVLYVAAGGATAFFWAYAVWVLLKADRFIEAGIAFVLAPLGALYGLLRFFGAI